MIARRGGFNHIVRESAPAAVHSAVGGAISTFALRGARFFAGAFLATAFVAVFLATVFFTAFFAAVFFVAFLAAVFFTAFFAAVFFTAFFAAVFFTAFFAAVFFVAFLAAVFFTAFFAAVFFTAFFAAVFFAAGFALVAAFAICLDPLLLRRRPPAGYEARRSVAWLTISSSGSVLATRDSRPENMIASTAARRRDAPQRL
jgi:hypothetical protein